ncbi:MAG: DUF1573 domain-containing protein [Acidobacteriota bacterium]|nr:DUF1573 domain-containing protein [Acidobacteriota bacterium]MDH3525279.1 DUF1573 domain-containing protein [Acidobacteriota bacterium]
MRHALGRRAFTFSVAALAVAGGALAQPRAVLVDPIVDVGIVPRGDLVEHTFEIANEGSGALAITEVKPTCGCTIVDYDRSIAGGATGRVVAKLSTKGLRGPVAKSIAVYTDDPRNPQLKLVIKANVRAWVETDPGYARFLAVRGQNSETVEQTLYSEEPGELVVTGVSSPFPFVEVGFREAAEDERLEGRPGRQWVVSTTLRRDAPEGSFADFVSVDLDHPKLERLKIPISGFVQPVVAVLPRVADFGRKDLSVPQSAILEVKNLGAAEVTLGGVETDVAGLVAKLEEVEKGRLFRLRLTLDPGMPKGDFRGVLKIPTSSRLQPEVRVDVRGTIL